MIVLSIELCGFAESPKVVDGDFNLFNIRLAEDYVNALFEENFDRVGHIDDYLFENICYWINYDERDKETVKELKSGTFMTSNQRTLIDAIYDKKFNCMAELYLDHERIYSPKLILTLLLSDCYDDYIFINPYDITSINRILNELYDFIEIEFLKQNDKQNFINKIKNNIKNVVLPKCYNQEKISKNYEWVKILKRKQI